MAKHYFNDDDGPPQSWDGPIPVPQGDEESTGWWACKMLMGLFFWGVFMSVCWNIKGMI